MTTRKKIYVLDTSVYLTSANSLYSFGTNDILVPLKVLEELDKHKNRQDMVGQQARFTIKKFDELREKKKGNREVRVSRGRGMLRFESVNNSKKYDLLPHDLDKNVPDNQIIATALYEKNKNPDRKVILVSRDINMRVVGTAVGLEVESYNAAQVVVDKEQLYSGTTELLVDEEYIDRLHESGYLSTSFLDDAQVDKFHPNQFVMLKSNLNEKNTTLSRFLSGSKELKKVNSKKTYLHGGIKAKNKEQSYAIDLLLDPEVPIVTLIGRAGSGKAQPLDSKVLTPCGWKRMGDIKVGDKVISVDGTPTVVNGVFPQGKKKIYKVCFTDGTSVECCGDHLWKTKTSKERDYGQNGAVRTLNEIKETLRYGKSNKRNHSIPMVSPIQFEYGEELELDPYFLGAILGDGTIRHSLAFSTADKQMVEILSPMVEKEGCHFKKVKDNKYDYRIIQKDIVRRDGKSINTIKEKLKKLNVWGLLSHEKHIPEKYLFSSVENRISLLQGLMDTDGTVDKSGKSVTFTTTSKKLSENVQFLIQSLGGTAKTRERTTSYTHNGEKRDGRVSYRTTVVLPNEIDPFLLDRKSSRVAKRRKYFPRRYIDKIEYIGEKESQCISVEHKEHLYVTENCIVTHNTLLALAAGLTQILETGKYTRLLVSRPVQPLGKDIGFLPGSLEEKMMPWLAPIQDNLEYLMRGSRTELQEYMASGTIEIEALTYIRGRSIADAFVIIDEAQNLSIHELKTIITRVGEGTKIILTGDIEQIDNVYVNDTSNGLAYAVEKFKTVDLAGHVTLQKGERSAVATMAAKIL